MWGCYVNSLKALSSLQATVTNFATNFLSSGLAGFFLFEEVLQFQVIKLIFRGQDIGIFQRVSPSRKATLLYRNMSRFNSIAAIAPPPSHP